jgi:hypothetical protein
MSGLHIPFPQSPAPPENTNISLELWVQRYNTAQFIDAEPVRIALTPRKEMRTPAGGVETVELPARAAQTFKVIMISPAGGFIEQRNDAGGGTERRADFILLGKWDAVVDVGDYWHDEYGQRWEVTSIIPYNGYEVRANVESYGRYPTNG